jgi:hypothetical protein
MINRFTCPCNNPFVRSDAVDAGLDVQALEDVAFAGQLFSLRSSSKRLNQAGCL